MSIRVIPHVDTFSKLQEPILSTVSDYTYNPDNLFRINKESININS